MNAQLREYQKIIAGLVRLQEKRLAQLINEGHLKVNSSTVLWVDENGLLTAQDLQGMKYEGVQEPAPPFHAGENADLNATECSPVLGLPIWFPKGCKKERWAWGTLLLKLVIKDLRLLPTITHIAWKDLSATLENAMSSQEALPSVVDHVNEAINKEEEDWATLGYFEDWCQNLDELLIMDLDDVSQALYRLAGIKADHINPEAAIREIDEWLADEIYMLLHMAYKLRVRTTSVQRLDRLASSAGKISAAFLPGKMGPLMKQQLDSLKQTGRE